MLQECVGFLVSWDVQHGENFQCKRLGIELFGVWICLQAFPRTREHGLQLVAEHVECTPRGVDGELRPRVDHLRRELRQPALHGDHFGAQQRRPTGALDQVCGELHVCLPQGRLACRCVARRFAEQCERGVDFIRTCKVLRRPAAHLVDSGRGVCGDESALQDLAQHRVHAVAPADVRRRHQSVGRGNFLEQISAFARREIGDRRAEFGFEPRQYGGVDHERDLSAGVVEHRAFDVLPKIGRRFGRLQRIDGIDVCGRQ